MTEAEKGVILRELGTDWQGNSGFARAMEKSKQKPREGYFPARGWKETVAADPQRRSFELLREEHRDPAVGEPDAPSVGGGVGERREYQTATRRYRVRVVARRNLPRERAGGAVDDGNRRGQGTGCASPAARVPRCRCTAGPEE